MALDLRSLALLREVIALGSISKAAARLRIAQPHVSRLIRSLEVELGTTLLERHAHGVRPTEAGRLLATASERIESEIGAVRARIADVAGEIAGTVTLGVPGSLALPLLPDLIIAVRDRHPAIKLRLVDGFSARLHEMMLRGQLDLALLYSDRPNAAFDVRPLLTEPLGLASAPAACEAPVDISALSDRRLALPAAPNRLRLLIDAAAAAAGIVLTVSEELDSYPVLIRMTRSGFAETVLPFSAVSADVAEGALIWRPITPTVERRISLVRSRDRSDTAAMRAVAVLVSEQVTREQARQGWCAQ